MLQYMFQREVQNYIKMKLTFQVLTTHGVMLKTSWKKFV